MNTEETAAPPISLFRHQDKSLTKTSHSILGALEARREAVREVEARKKRVKRAFAVIAFAFLGILSVGFVTLSIIVALENRKAMEDATRETPTEAKQVTNAASHESPEKARAKLPTEFPVDLAPQESDQAMARISADNATPETSSNPLRALFRNKPKEEPLPQENPLRALTQKANRPPAATPAPAKKTEAADPLMELVEKEEQKNDAASSKTPNRHSRH